MSLNSSTFSQIDTKLEAYRLIYDPTRLLSLLYSKYGDIDEDYYILHTNQLIFNVPSKFNIKYKELKYIDLENDYLKRIYKRKESINRIPKLSDYYKNYHLFFCRPTLCNRKLGYIMCEYEDNKAELFYKKNYPESKEELTEKLLKKQKNKDIKEKNAMGEDKRDKFTSCSVSTVSTEGRLISVNSNFLSMAWSNMGEIVVVDSSQPFNIKADQPRIKGHRANVLDLEFSPFSSDLLACAFDDCSVLLYKIPEGGLTEHITQEVQIYQKHTKKTPFVTFNPLASDVLCSAAFNGEVHIWNALKGDTYCELNAEDTPTWVSWSPNGSLLGLTTKNKFMNVFDPRSKKLIFKHQINEAFQSAKFAWLDNDTFVTTGWNKAGAKLLRLWDVRKVNEDLTSSGEVNSVQIDTSKTVTTPYVDRESKLLFTVGKGEASTHTYDYSDGTLRKGLIAKSTEPSIYTVMFERKCLDYNKNEVDRFARYVNSQKVYYVSFTIPRRNPGFDASLYPPVESGEAALTYDQWVAGENAEPIRKDINTIENKFVSKVETFVKQEVKVTQKTPEEKVNELEGKLAELSVKLNQLEEENAKLKKELASLA